jgi:hypothetical protein
MAVAAAAAALAAATAWGAQCGGTKALALAAVGRLVDAAAALTSKASKALLSRLSSSAAAAAAAASAACRQCIGSSCMQQEVYRVVVGPRRRADGVWADCLVWLVRHGPGWFRTFLSLLVLAQSANSWAP